MELKDGDAKEHRVFGESAGWFCDNNLVAEAGRVYTFKYTSFTDTITANDFKKRLNTRVLNNIYD